MTDGAVMRSGKNDFQLLNEPMLEWVDPDEARQIVASGGKAARCPAAERIRDLPRARAINILLYFIRPQAEHARSGHGLCTLLRHRAAEFGRSLRAGQSGFKTRVLRGG